MVDHADLDHTGITGVGGAITVENEGTPLATAATTLDFVGAGVTASGAGAEKTITIAGAAAEFTTQQASVLTGQGLTGNNSWVDLATAGPAVTVTIGASGLAKVTLTARADNSNAGGAGAMGFAVSGASTIAAGLAKAVFWSGGTHAFNDCMSAVWIVTGLAAGSTTFTAKYNQTGAAGTTNWVERYIIVEPVL